MAKLIAGIGFLGALLLILVKAQGVTYTPRAATAGHYQLWMNANGSCDKPVQEIMHGNLTSTLKPEQYFELKRRVEACGGKLVELDENGKPKG